jgi:transmembrane sensor
MSLDSDMPEDPHDIAVDWVLRKREGPLTRKERAAFETWLAADPVHAAAYREAEELSAELFGLYPARQPQQAPAKRRKRPLALALTCAAGVAGIALFFGDISNFVLSDYVTRTGEMQSLTLEDGSRVELGPRSAIAVHFAPGSRRVTLLAGEAWFDVAPDPSRPFAVEAAGGTVTALGTSFDIALEQAQARVTVTTHRVKVASGGQEVIAKAGQETSFAPGAPARAAAPADVAKLTAWRRGKLIVEDEALGTVLAALGRYHRGFIYCLWAEICARRVSGVYFTRDPLQALAEIEASLGLSALHLSNYLIVLRD